MHDAILHMCNVAVPHLQTVNSPSPTAGALDTKVTLTFPFFSPGKYPIPGREKKRGPMGLASEGDERPEKQLHIQGTRMFTPSLAHPISSAAA